MKVKDRYHEHDGQWWFATRERLHDEKFPEHWDRKTTDADMSLWWEPLESVEITDALACSRAELGPVYVVMEARLAPKNPVKLHGVEHGHCVFFSGDAGGIGHYQIAHPDELRAAGLWDE